MSAADKLRDLHATLTGGEWRNAFVSKRCVKKHHHRPDVCDYSDISFIESSHDICSTTGDEVAGNYDYEDGGIIKKSDTVAICELRNALPDIIAVIAAAETVSAIERTGVLPDFQPLADALAALNARLTDTRDGGGA